MFLAVKGLGSLLLLFHVRLWEMGSFYTWLLAINTLEITVP